MVHSVESTMHDCLLVIILHILSNQLQIWLHILRPYRLCTIPAENRPYAQDDDLIGLSKEFGLKRKEIPFPEDCVGINVSLQ